MSAIYALYELGYGNDNKRIVKAEEAISGGIKYLLSMQNDDGGWSEHYSSYYSERPVIGKSTVEHTSWALISLMECGIEDQKIIERGIAFLLEKQKGDGSFPKAYTAAVIDPDRYEIYSLVFPLIALSKYKKRCET